ncbi:endolytic transglycosylase MltG [Cellulosilyticum ruminicola]|uniref:endolytic transglycosylase MltG n=1 Tax=Cellulosilyticum ruminicola TaxID=425254 RepID=UPI0006CFC078|nr:endolytic transglycosylase MltG [Cellulosilyticum ruminicola]
MKKRNIQKRVIGSFAFNSIITILIVVGSILALHKSYAYTSHIIDQESTRKYNEDVFEMVLNIEADTSLNELALLLKEHNLISNVAYFKLEAHLSDFKSPFIAGEYTLSSNMSTNEILKMLATDFNNEEETVQFTIPEGYTIPQIAAKLDSEGIIDAKDFLDAVQNKNYDYDFLQNIPATTTYKLEGYLFPDTYTVRKNATPEEIIIRMLMRFKEVVAGYTTYLEHTNYSLHDLLTIASMIEGEAKLDEERPTISGVIYNRLDAHMNLQMCSTIQYLLDKRKATLSLDDLKVDSPYNTYLYTGLPPGPICAPGETSIKAALLPEQHNYYYFVISDTASDAHHFSETAQEHSTAKIRYAQSIDKNFYE